MRTISDGERIHARRKTFERADKWLRGYVLSVMKQQGLKQLKTPSNTIFIRQSDGVVITEVAEVPATLQTAEIKLPLWLWNHISEEAAAFSNEVTEALKAVRVKAEPSIAAIKKLIKAGESVPGADLEFRDNVVLR
jgi:hypothetical protein